MKRWHYLTHDGKDCEEYDLDTFDYKIRLHTLRRHTHMVETEYDMGYVSSITFVMPKEFRKKPHQFIHNFFEFYSSNCGHEHDCCGCICKAYVIRTIKLNSRDWNIHVQFIRNL